MSNVPPKLLKVLVSGVSPQANWSADSTPYAGFAFRWTVTLTVTPQSHSDPATPIPFFYDGRSVVTGDWFSNAVGGTAWRVFHINTQTSSSVNCIVEDVEQYNTYNDPTTDGDGSPHSSISGFLFSVDQSGQPVLGPLTPNLLSYQWASDLLGRFDQQTPPVSTALKATAASTAIDSSGSILSLIDGNLFWVPVLDVLGVSGASVSFHLELEDGSGALLLQDSTGYIIQES